MSAPPSAARAIGRGTSDGRGVAVTGRGRVSTAASAGAVSSFVWRPVGGPPPVAKGSAGHAVPSATFVSKGGRRQDGPVTPGRPRRASRPVSCGPEKAIFPTGGATSATRRRAASPTTRPPAKGGRRRPREAETGRPPVPAVATLACRPGRTAAVLSIGRGPTVTGSRPATPRPTPPVGRPKAPVGVCGPRGPASCEGVSGLLVTRGGRPTSSGA